MSLLSLTRRIALMDGLKLHNRYRRIYNITLTAHEATKSIIIDISLYTYMFCLGGR